MSVAPDPLRLVRWIAHIGDWHLGPMTYTDAQALASEHGGYVVPLWDPNEPLGKGPDLAWKNATAIEEAASSERRKQAMIEGGIDV